MAIPSPQRGRQLLVAATLAAAVLFEACWADGPAMGAPMTAVQGQKVAAHLEAAASMQRRDAVKAFLHLREALRLEQLWSGNTLGGDSRASAAMARFTTDLMQHDDDRLLRVLHSRSVPLPDKLSLIRVLEETVILRYPGVGTDQLLQDYDE